MVAVDWGVLAEYLGRGAQLSFEGFPARVWDLVRCRVEHVDEGTDVIVDVVRGLRPVADLQMAGVYMTRIPGGYEVDNRRGIEAQARIRDVAEGLLRYRARIEELRAWARVILMGAGVDLADEFETRHEGHVLLDALWDLSFDGVLEDDMVCLVERVLEDGEAG